MSTPELRVIEGGTSRPAKAYIQTPHGGGNGGDMEARISRIEGQLDKLADKVGAVETKLAELTAHVSHLPSKGFVFTSAGTTIGLLTAVVVFADKIKAILGL